MNPEEDRHKIPLPCGSKYRIVQLRSAFEPEYDRTVRSAPTTNPFQHKPRWGKRRRKK